MSLATNRLTAGAAAAVLAGTALAVLPPATAPASAGTRVAVKGQQVEKLRARVVAIAKRQLGDRYVLGATGPSAFDCSGLVVYAYRKAAGTTLPRTSYMQRDQLRSVSKQNRRPGDIVVVHGGGHVGIYVGHNRIVHASTPATGVKTTELSGYYGREVTGYRRVIVAR